MSQLDILEEELSRIELSRLGTVSLGGHGLIMDPEKFVLSHIEILKSNPGNRCFMPYFKRLKLFRDIIIDK